MLNNKLKSNVFILLSDLGKGGLQRVAATVINNLAEKVPMFVISKRKIIEYPVKVSVKYMYKDVHFKRLQYLIFPFVFIKYFCLVHKYRPVLSLSISAVLTEDIINMLVSHIFKIPSVISVHGTWNYSSKKGFFSDNTYHSLVSYLLKHTNTKVIAVSEGAKISLVENYGIPSEKIKVIYNPIDNINIQQLSTESILDNLIMQDIPTIITVGRLSHEKSQWHLIRSFAFLCREQPANLLICGIGVEEGYLKNLVNDLKINNYVKFVGWQENPYKFMSRSRVFVLSSMTEGLPNVLIEAMASGCPVISADCCLGVREIIGEHNEYGLLGAKMTGIRHSANDPLDSGEINLLTLMRAIIEDNDLQRKYINLGKERAKFFSVEKGIKEYEKYIQEYLD